MCAGVDELAWCAFVLSNHIAIMRQYCNDAAVMHKQFAVCRDEVAEATARVRLMLSTLDAAGLQKHVPSMVRVMGLCRDCMYALEDVWEIGMNNPDEVHGVAYAAKMGYMRLCSDLYAVCSHARHISTPPELQTERATVYIERAKAAGLIDDSGRRWLKSGLLLACFAREMSTKLKIGRGHNADGTPRINWKVFENWFEWGGRCQLKHLFGQIQQTGVEPSGVEVIDQIFED